MEIETRDVTFNVCMKQFIQTVEFLAEHNQFFKGEVEKISDELMRCINELANSPCGETIGTMGFQVYKFEEGDGFGTIEIMVDPAVAVELCHLICMKVKGKVKC